MVFLLKIIPSLFGDAAHLPFPDCTLIISGKPDLINVFPLLKDGFY